MADFVIIEANGNKRRETVPIAVWHKIKSNPQMKRVFKVIAYFNYPPEVLELQNRLKGKTEIK